MINAFSSLLYKKTIRSIMLKRTFRYSFLLDLFHIYLSRSFLFIETISFDLDETLLLSHQTHTSCP